MMSALISRPWRYHLSSGEALRLSGKPPALHAKVLDSILGISSLKNVVGVAKVLKFQGAVSSLNRQYLP